MSQVIATIAQLCIYPVKSMAGLSVERAHVGLDGILGDRQYAFVRADQAARNSFPWMTARESSRMLFYKPSFSQPPTPEQPEPALQVRTPAGTEVAPDDVSLRDSVSGDLGQPVFLMMMVNLNPETGTQDPRVLRTIAQKHQGQAGVYANVVRPGVVRVGDTIRLMRTP